MVAQVYIIMRPLDLEIRILLIYQSVSFARTVPKLINGHPPLKIYVFMLKIEYMINAGMKISKCCDLNEAPEV